MKILAINPWIYDFAAYDFWLKPYGFLVLLSYLKNYNVEIDYIDCLEKKITYDNFGRGKYQAETISKPEIFKNIPRYFKRYGLSPEEFIYKLKGKNPEIILLTSSMTYWYPAVKESALLLKKAFPKSILVLGGTYVTLLPQHAKENIPVDFIFPNQKLKAFFKMLGLKYEYNRLFSTLPHYQSFYSSLHYAVLRTSWGCPFNCSYCAIKKLFPSFFRIPQGEIIKFILDLYHQGIKNFVFYDEALLYPPSEAKSLLKKIASLGLKINFHTPNALHLKFLDEETASLLKACGFINPHFGLETLDQKRQYLWGKKATTQDLLAGINYLKKGGFRDGEYSIYLLLGYPGQNLEKLKEEIDFLHSQGARISLAEFSCTPQTEIFNHYQEILKEPLLQNNSAFSFFPSKEIRKFYEIKNYARKLNKEFPPLYYS